MIDFEVQRCTRRCAKTDREFQPSEEFYSALISEGSAVVRYDYSKEAWDTPPDNALGWWKSRMPEPNARKVNWAPNDVMLHYFEQLADDASKVDVRYVLALLMIRRRVVRLEETRHDEDGRELMVLYCPKNENEYVIRVVEPVGDRVKEIQEELARLLFADAT